MKFPRNTRIFRGTLDAAPLACVFFLLLMFVQLGSLIYTPGARVPLELPRADGLPGTDRPTIAVAVDAGGRFYFKSQEIHEDELRSRLRAAAAKSPEPLTLVVLADKAITLDKLLELTLLANEAGIRETTFATLPRVFSDSPVTPPSAP